MATQPLPGQPGRRRLIRHFGPALLLLFLITPDLARAQAPMVVSHGPESFAVGKHLDVLRDDSGHLTLAQVSAPENKGRWKKSRREVPNFGFSSATYWFRFRVRSSASRAHTWLLEVGYPMLDRVDVYQSLPGGGWDHEVGGDHLPFSARSIPHRNFVFRVPLDPGETRTVLLRVATQSSVQVPLTLWSRDGFLHKDHKEQAALWTYYGLVLVMALYNLFVFLSVRDRSYIYYVGYILSFVLFQMSLNGVAFEVLWPNAVWWANTCVPVWLSLAVIFGGLFVRSFLNAQYYTPKLDWLLRAIIAITVVALVYSLFGSYHVAIQWTSASGLINVLLMLVVGFYIFHLGYRPARYFVAAWSIFLTGAVLYALKAFGVLPSVFVTHYGMQIGNALEVVLLSFALADRINILKAESQRAQDRALAVEREAKHTLQREVERQTEELREANQQLQDFDQQRARFFQNISHELRTPLTVLLNPLDRLQHSPLLAQAPAGLRLPKTLRSMERNTLRLLRLVNQLLDFSRLESGRTRVSYERRDLQELLEPIVDGFQSFARSKGLTLTFRVDGELPEVFVDPEKLDTVLCNLLSNACKFTDEGGHVLVKVSANHDHALVAVKDSGIGVAEADRERIFERFGQAQTEASRDFQGSGIGLALARELVELTGGKLTLDSEVGFGSTFTLWLPLGEDHIDAEATRKERASSDQNARILASHMAATALEAEAGLDASPTAPPLDVLSSERPLILVVEDNPDMRALVVETCHREFRVLEAENGEQALSLLAEHRPALVVSDIMMPGMDGHELLARMRTTPEYRQIPVMLLTARAGPQQRLEGLESGADEYLTKPFDSRELIARVRNLVRLRETERELERLNASLREEMTDQTAAIEQMRTLRRFVPDPVRAWLRRSALNPVAAPERAQLTLFHVQLRLVASTVASLEVEDELAIHRLFLERVLEACVRAGATVDAVQPDHVAGFFGAPDSQSVAEDARRAAQLALDLWSALNGASWPLDDSSPAAPDVLITLHTGYGSVGPFGAKQLKAYTAVGSVRQDGDALLRVVGAGVVCTEPTWLHLRDTVPGTPLGDLLAPHRSLGLHVHTLAGTPTLPEGVDALAQTMIRQGPLTPDPGRAAVSSASMPAVTPVPLPSASPASMPAALSMPMALGLPAPLPEGTLVADRYRIEGELGSGGMGRVFQAHDQKLEQQVALKLVRPDFAADPARVERLKQEVRLARSITHPSVARIFNFDEWAGLDYITMELLRGETLQERLDEHGPLAIAAAVEILSTLCEGLAAAHEARVLHRDLKPSNIMLEPDGRVVILDFGIARAVAASDETLSRTGELLGTPQYMAPELVLGNEVGPYTDLYALGAVAFEMVTGRPVFEAESILAVTYKQVAEPAPDPRSLRPELPEALAAVIRRCLEKAPDARYASALEVKEALKRLGSDPA